MFLLNLKAKQNLPELMLVLPKEQGQLGEERRGTDGKWEERK